MTFFNKLRESRYFNLYRIITALGFVAAALLVVLTPLQLPDPDDWANYIGVQNFAAGKLVVDGRTMWRQMVEVGEKGGALIQYLPLDEARTKWALEKAPGSVFYLIPFYKLGIPRWGNILLMLGTVIVTYMLLKRLRDEKAAMVGSLLMLFTPIALVMQNRVYMDTYASLAFLAIGAGLYFYYHLDRDNLGTFKGGALLFLAFFFTTWSVVTRYTNAPIAIIIGLHYVITRFIDWRKGHGTGLKPEIIPVILGAGIPVAAMLLYDYYVFGSPWTYSYALSPYPIGFAYQYIGQEWEGESIPLQILRFNGEGALRNWWIGFPLLFAGIPAFIFVLYRKMAGKWSSLHEEMPWGILLVLIGWFISVFILYLGYEWTAGLVKGGGAVLFNRFLLPGLFPVVVITALVMARFPYRVLIPVLAVLIIFGVMFYLQWSFSDWHILPAWVTERTLESRWADHVFPPWTEWERLYGK